MRSTIKGPPSLHTQWLRVVEIRHEHKLAIFFSSALLSSWTAILERTSLSGRSELKVPRAKGWEEYLFHQIEIVSPRAKPPPFRHEFMCCQRALQDGLHWTLNVCCIMTTINCSLGRDHPEAPCPTCRITPNDTDTLAKGRKKHVILFNHQCRQGFLRSTSHRSVGRHLAATRRWACRCDTSLAPLPSLAGYWEDLV
jgi:hypothetical protein